LKSCCVLQEHYDDERDKTVVHITTPDLQDQDQDHSLQDQDQDRLFWSETGLVLRPTFSDLITSWDANPRSRTTSSAWINIGNGNGSSSWVLHRGFGYSPKIRRLADPVPVTLDLLNPKSIGFDKVSRTTALPTFK